MSDFAFLSEGVAVQSAAALQACGSSGKFYSLGDDVNALFFVPSGAPEDSPAAAASTYLTSLNMPLHFI